MEACAEDRILAEAVWGPAPVQLESSFKGTLNPEPQTVVLCPSCESLNHAWYYEAYCLEIYL